VIYPLQRLAQSGDVCRPVVPVRPGGGTIQVDGLIDTGAAHCLASADLADLFGANLHLAIAQQDLCLGGKTYPAQCASVVISFEHATWSAPVWFCSGLHSPPLFLGVNGFLDHVVFTLDVASSQFRLEVNP